MLGRFASFLFIFALIAACVAAPAKAGEPAQRIPEGLSSLYSRESLAEAHKLYGPNIEWNYKNAVIPVLRSDERRVLEGVSLDFPLIAPDNRNPFVIDVDLKRQRIVVPIFTIKFMDDLSIAYAWLMIKGDKESIVSDYIRRLKYRDAKDFPGGRYPTPHEALKIPRDALDNPRVDDISGKILKGTVVYLLGQGASAVLTLRQVSGSRPIMLGEASRSPETMAKFRIGTSSSLFGLETLNTETHRRPAGNAAPIFRLESCLDEEQC